MANDGAAPENAKSNAGILIAVLLVFGLVLGGFGIYRYNIGKESSKWPSVQGKITYAHAQSRRVKKQNQYIPSIKYTYNVKGKTYTGTRITASDEYQKTLSGAKDILKKYPVSEAVSVYYNPREPGTSLLEAGLAKNVFVLIVAAVACFFLAIAIFVSAMKKSYKSDPRPLFYDEGKGAASLSLLLP